MLQGKITDELCCLNNPYWTPRLVKRFQKNSAKIVFLVIISFYSHFSYWLFFCSVSVLQSGMNFTRLACRPDIYFLGLIIKETNSTRLPFIADFIKSTSTSLVTTIVFLAEHTRKNYAVWLIISLIFLPDLTVHTVEPPERKETWKELSRSFNGRWLKALNPAKKETQV